MAPCRSRAATLADRIEASAVSSHSIACLSCQRRHIRCIRSLISSRCAACARGNHRCVTDSSTHDPFLSSVRADIRRLRSSLLAFDRSLENAACNPRSSISEGSPRLAPARSSSSNNFAIILPQRHSLSGSRANSLVPDNGPSNSVGRDSVSPGNFTVPVSLVGSSSGTPVPSAESNAATPLASSIPIDFLLNPATASSSVDSIVSPSSGPAVSFLGTTANPPFEFINPSALFLEDFEFPDLPAGVYDLGSFFATSDFSFADM